MTCCALPLPRYPAAEAFPSRAPLPEPDPLDEELEPLDLDPERDSELCESELPLPLPLPLPLHPLLLGTMRESESSQLPGQQPDELAESSGHEPGQQPEELSLEDEELSLEEDELSLDDEELSDDDKDDELPLDEEPEKLLLPPKEELEERAFKKSSRVSAARSWRRAIGASTGRAAEWARGAERRVAAEMSVQGWKDESVSAADMAFRSLCWSKRLLWWEARGRGAWSEREQSLCSISLC